jgi:hypothetical protein
MMSLHLKRPLSPASAFIVPPSGNFKARNQEARLCPCQCGDLSTLGCRAEQDLRPWYVTAAAVSPPCPAKQLKQLKPSKPPKPKTFRLAGYQLLKNEQGRKLGSRKFVVEKRQLCE